MRVMGVQMDMGNTREVGPDDYMEERRSYSCGGGTSGKM